MPRWVKVFGIIGIVVVLGFIIFFDVLLPARLGEHDDQAQDVNQEHVDDGGGHGPSEVSRG